jgi:Icc-related predicted phosphoesterase
LLIAAVADVHSPKYLELLKSSLRTLGRCDLFLLVGDLVLKNDRSQLPAVLAAVREAHRGPILACYGNEEYEQDQESYESFQEIGWIDKSPVTIEVGGVMVGIVGSRGSLDRPTFWQRTNIKGIRGIFSRRVEEIDRTLAELRGEIRIVMTHYSPTYRTLVGERESAWPEMGCRRLEEVIKRRQPDVWFHGHAHRGTVLDATIGRTLISNVSLPARRGITKVELPRKVGLERFV